MSSCLEQLKTMTSVVADTGDIAKIKLYKPEDATTNPTLILQACQMEEYRDIVADVVAKAKDAHTLGLSDPPDDLIEDICDRLAVAFGTEILKVVPGYVSTEVDASLSFNTAASVEKALKIIRLYEEAGVSKNRVLIKLASTWECIQACKALEEQGIKCNMTLLFSFSQAVACAEAGAFLISPFVGRILDWYQGKNPEADYLSDSDKDPGVISVTSIYQYYRRHGYNTIVMGASFRNKGEILSLAGCDKLTIGPKFLQELEESKESMVRRLSPEMDTSSASSVRIDEKLHLDEAAFRWMFNEDAMATEKLSEGIRNFNKDSMKLKELIKGMLA